jgi:hypothetical protein
VYVRACVAVLAVCSCSSEVNRGHAGVQKDVFKVRSVIFEANEQCLLLFTRVKTVCLAHFPPTQKYDQYVWKKIICVSRSNCDFTCEPAVNRCMAFLYLCSIILNR